jgi:SAM-dependent methyltransferase
MSYYKNFGLILGNPLWRMYLRWRYKKSIEDFNKLNFTPNFKKKDFTCLLCGVGNEVTAEEFIKFVLKRNTDPDIWIIDLGKEQIDAVKQMVIIKFPNLNIKVMQIDALKLEGLIKGNTIDWIETDGLFEFFDNATIRKLLSIWKSLLTKEGFITTTATSSRWALQEYFDKVKIWVGKVWLGVTVYSHTRAQMRQNFKEVGLKFVEGPTMLPYFKRYSLIP